MSNGKPWVPSDKESIIITVVTMVLLAVLAGVSASRGWTLWLAASVGGLGGLVHEIAQSGGKVAYFAKKDDGLYIGSLAGMVLGAVAGLLVVRGHMTGETAAIGNAQLSYEVFTAGLALKGVMEAAGGQVGKPVP
jgi:hypothetical protein